jgi:Skp family chaperone for outer membrane proteins
MKKTYLTLMIMAGLAGLAAAQSPDTKDAAAKDAAVKSAKTMKSAAPVIEANLRARFWRHQSELLAAKANYDTANAKMQADVDEMKKICGASGVGSGTDGEPECQKPKTDGK